MGKIFISILEETKLEDYIKDADFVVTGEGRLDGQTVFGKAPIGVAQIAKKYNKPVLAFAWRQREGIWRQWWNRCFGSLSYSRK